MENNEENIDATQAEIVLDSELMSSIVYDSFVENYGELEIDGILEFWKKSKNDLLDPEFQSKIHELFKKK